MLSAAETVRCNNAVYTLENHFCYPEAVGLAIRELTLTESPQIPVWISHYSHICSQVLLRKVAFERSKPGNHYEEADFKQLQHLLSESRLIPLIDFDSKAHQPESRLQAIATNISNWCQEIDLIFTKYGQDLATTDTFMQQKGIYPQLAIFFLPGHIVFDRFILPLVEGTAYQLRTDYIKSLRSHGQRIQTYQNQTKADPVAKLRDGYKQMISSPNYPWLRQIGEQLQRDFSA